MKERFINMLKEATDNRTTYTPSSVIETPSQPTSPFETNSQQETPYHTNTDIDKSNKNTNSGTAEPISAPQKANPAKQINQIVPDKTTDQIQEAAPASSTNCQQILAVWQALFPTIPGGLNLLPNYTPQNLSQKNYDFNFSSLSERETARLIREIYLRILRSLDTYSLLIRNESGNNQRNLVLLRTQMQVLSSVLLNVYQDYTATNVVPLRVNINSFLPNNLKNAYLYLYSEIYCIFYLLNKLIFALSGSDFSGQLTTALSNIKYQLNIIYTLYSNIN